MDELLDVSDEVAAALAAGDPVVALESTIITHGMPYPDNRTMAAGVEKTIRDAGAVPATIAIIKGRCRVGLTEDALEDLARKGPEAAKASIRDLAALSVQQRDAGTTVATTMRIAAAAGIRVFATGGIGGVHRGAEETFDISADLVELSRTPVTVVCAGAKSILDIPKTLEVLETNGVPVIGHGTDEFPAFYAQSSGHPVDYRFDSLTDIAAMILRSRALGLPGGILVANPVPADVAMPHDEIDGIIERALRDADASGITRKDLTPFLLGRIVELTGGRSLTANIALVHNNARTAAGIARAVSDLG